jgi:hypothetical protein
MRAFREKTTFIAAHLPAPYKVSALLIICIRNVLQIRENDLPEQLIKFIAKL